MPGGPVAWLSAGLAAIAVIAGWTVASRLPMSGSGRWPPVGWLVVQCDVGQGSATVIRAGPGRAVLVDTGPEPDLVDGCLRRLSVTQLDLLVLTHYHADHAAGLPGALRGRRVDAALVNPFGQPADMAADVRRWLGAARVPVTAGWAGLSGFAGGGTDRVRWRTLWPSPPLPSVGAGSGSGGDENSVINDESTVTLLQVHGRRVLELGDVEQAGQTGVLRAWPLDVPSVDVVTVAHHGSARQLPALYRRAAPAVALIGVGVNDYGHPAPRTTSMLAAQGAAVLRTDREGDLAVVVQGDGSLAVAVRRGGSPMAAAARGPAAVHPSLARRTPAVRAAGIRRKQPHHRTVPGGSGSPATTAGGPRARARWTAWAVSRSPPLRSPIPLADFAQRPCRRGVAGYGRASRQPFPGNLARRRIGLLPCQGAGQEPDGRPGGPGARPHRARHRRGGPAG